MVVLDVASAAQFFTLIRNPAYKATVVGKKIKRFGSLFHFQTNLNSIFFYHFNQDFTAKWCNFSSYNN
jgi:hypothetical protein